MKTIVLLVCAAVIYYIVGREAPVAPVKNAVTQRELPPLISGDRNAASTSTALKRPLDRTRDVLSQVRTRNGAGEF